LVALCQFLPGPASSQVGIALGLQRGGLSGAAAAWLGFTLPSALLLILFAYGITQFGNEINGGLLHGLKIVAVAVVAQAILAMARTLCPDRVRATMAVSAAALLAVLPAGYGQVAAIIAGGIIGSILLPKSTGTPHSTILPRLSRTCGIFALILFFGLLAVLPLLTEMSDDLMIKQLTVFYRAGSLVFGGGHVVLPLLQAAVVPSGWVSNDAFLAGYGATQAMPGPLFTFAAYLGAVSNVQPFGWIGGALCLLAVFLPAFLLIIGVLPFWERLSRYETIQTAIQGINAVVVGLLLAAFYDPVWTSAIHSKTDFAFASIAFVMLAQLKFPPWLVVLLSASAGYWMSFF
jgi:chromate transporter